MSTRVVTNIFNGFRSIARSQEDKKLHKQVEKKRRQWSTEQSLLAQQEKNMAFFDRESIRLEEDAIHVGIKLDKANAALKAAVEDTKSTRKTTKYAIQKQQRKADYAREIVAAQARVTLAKRLSEELILEIRVDTNLARTEYNNALQAYKAYEAAVEADKLATAEESMNTKRETKRRKQRA